MNSSAIIAGLIDCAEFEVSICTFSIDEPKIVLALENAVKRGVKVRVISETPFTSCCIPTKIDAENSLFHMKVMIVDSKVLIIGSANFTTHSLF
ncbi:MAG TPA: phospholipase D-like domain-containing protein, partial [Pseudothermotoga sp.]